MDVTHVFFILRLIYWNSYSMFSFCSCHVQCSGSFMHESLLVVLVQREREHWNAFAVGGALVRSYVHVAWIQNNITGQHVPANFN